MRPVRLRRANGASRPRTDAGLNERDVIVCDQPRMYRVSAPDVRSERAIIEPVPLHERRFKRTIRRRELRQIVPLADTTIYEMEQRGEFPRRFYLTSRCVV